MKQILLAALFIFSAGSVRAWGGRGHHTICDAAVYLTKEKGLRDYLQAKPHIMGYLCNIPDIYWRDVDTNRLGDAAHYVDLELLGMNYKDIPLDYRKIVDDFTDKPNPLKPDTKIVSIPKEFGSNWWRADQFYRRAIGLGEKWKTATAPTNTKEEQSDSLPFNQIAFDFIVNIGIMGHFVGDNGQPFHSTVNYDGYDNGHGGIHGYYEDSLVAALPGDLNIQVIAEGKKLQKNEARHGFLSEKSVLARMKALALVANAELQTAFQLDKVKKPSTLTFEKGMTMKTAAEREPAEKMSPKFQKLLTLQLARSATLLAKIWDEAYVEVGRPKLAAHKSYRFPIQPEFVAPDYFELKDIQRK